MRAFAITPLVRDRAFKHDDHVLPAWPADLKQVQAHQCSRPLAPYDCTTSGAELPRAYRGAEHVTWNALNPAIVMISHVSLRAMAGNFRLVEATSADNDLSVALTSFEEALRFLRQFTADELALSNLRRLLYQVAPGNVYRMENHVVLEQVARLVVSRRVAVVRVEADRNFDCGGREGRGHEYSNLPERLRLFVLGLGRRIRQSGDATLIHRYERWTITYKDAEEWKNGRDEVYGSTLFPTQATSFFRGTQKLTAHELGFVVAHEFRHLDKANDEIGGGSTMGGFLSGQNIRAERDANEWAAAFLKMEIPEKFKDYGVKY